MFTLLSHEAVSQTPGRTALYASLTINLCTLAALTWFSLFSISTVRFELTTVHAGSLEPVRRPQRLYIPIQTSPRWPTDRKNAIAPVTDMPRQTEPSGDAGFNLTAVPSEFIALLDTDTASKPAAGITLAGMRVVPPLKVTEPSLLLPEPPPGEPDIKPPPVIGGRLEPAELIKQTVPVYPPLARNARVEGVVVLEGTVNVSGSVENVRAVEGHPLLVDEALRA